MEDQAPRLHDAVAGGLRAGWSKTVSHLQPATQTYPENPLGPDVLLPPDQTRKTWPHRQDVPMHFAHPRFGAVLAGGEGDTLSVQD